MRIRIPLVGAAAALVAVACGGDNQAPTLPSLEGSGPATVVCATEDFEPRPRAACPDFEDDGEQRRLYGLVTQPFRGEVALIDVTAATRASPAGGNDLNEAARTVVDTDPSTPGLNFLPVRENPVDVAATPGGAATFVAIAEPGREGLQAIVTRCMGRAADGAPARDLTLWPSCSLPAAPGKISVLVGPEASADAACDGAATPVRTDACAADLSKEGGPVGRRKLLVTLPSLGALAVVDAQDVLGRARATYEPCIIERFIELPAAAPTDVETLPLPDELTTDDGTCTTGQVVQAPEGTPASRPVDVAVADGVAHVADAGAARLHRLDVSDPCAPVALPPLAPRSLEQPDRVVTTSTVAVSPRLQTGERFVYATDATDGSVMVFDVSGDLATTAPIAFENATYLPNLPPDRISFDAPVASVTFVKRDEPNVDATIGSALEGVQCDPDPALSPSSVGASYRTDTNYDNGASPRQLRGIFALFMLTNGRIAIVDVEDHDAACRRPIIANPEATPDVRGCANDPSGIGFFTSDGTEDGSRTTTAEFSCNVVERHRARSASFMLTNDDRGIRAPTLRTNPQLRDGDGATLRSDQSDDGRLLPKVIAVAPDALEPAQVTIGTRLFSSAPGVAADLRLEVDPALAEESSVQLLAREPRSFPSTDGYSATFEGSLFPLRTAGSLTITDTGARAVLTDQDVRFCDQGVRDRTLAAARGVELGVPDTEAFSRRDGDYVQLRGELPESDDPYWNQAGRAGRSCGDVEGQGYFTCTQAFGTLDEPTAARDFAIVQAFQGELVLEPRNFTTIDEARRQFELAACCFGYEPGLDYLVRGGSHWVVRSGRFGLQHNITAAPDDLRCVEDCRPRRRRLASRAYEVTFADEACPDAAACTAVACVKDSREPLDPSDPCVFENPTHRFGVYRGVEPSARDMSFRWDLQGGFSTLTFDLGAGSTQTLPQDVEVLDTFDMMLVTDGSAQGVVLFDLDDYRSIFTFR